MSALWLHLSELQVSSTNMKSLTVKYQMSGVNPPLLILLCTSVGIYLCASNPGANTSW